MMEITPDIMNQLRDHSQQIPIEAPAEVPNSLYVPESCEEAEAIESCDELLS